MGRRRENERKGERERERGQERERERASSWRRIGITALMSTFFHAGGQKREGNLFPVIFHRVSLCSDILHPFYQLFAACADRWRLFFDMHSRLAHTTPRLHSPHPPHLQDRSLLREKNWF